MKPAATIYVIAAYEAVGLDGEKSTVKAAVGLDVGNLDPEQAEDLARALEKFAEQRDLPVRWSRT